MTATWVDNLEGIYQWLASGLLSVAGTWQKTLVWIILNWHIGRERWSVIPADCYPWLEPSQIKLDYVNMECVMLCWQMARVAGVCYLWLTQFVIHGWSLAR